jgi:hypothetical protein
MKHNKKRNVAFVYEMLSREVTKAILAKDSTKKHSIVSLVKEHFKEGSPLLEELRLYRTLLETNSLPKNLAEKIVQETKIAHARLDGAQLFTAQSQLISDINKKVGQEAWSNFVPNFKSLASINAIFNSKTTIKKRVLFEQAIADKMSSSQDVSQQDPGLKPVDNLVYRSFIEKFNDKYTNLLSEQKELLNRYITSFVDDGLELRVYMNEELSRLKSLLGDKAEHFTAPIMEEKLQGVVDYLEEFRRRDFGEEDLHRILKTQELVEELANHDFD